MALAALDGVTAMVKESSDKRTAVWAAFAGVAGAAIGAGITSGFSYLSHQYDLDAKMIELSVGILRAEVTQETIPLRQWAIDVMDKRANFHFDQEQRAVLLKQPLPFKAVEAPILDGPILEVLRTYGFQPVPRWLEQELKRRLEEQSKKPTAPGTNDETNAPTPLASRRDAPARRPRGFHAASHGRRPCNASRRRSSYLSSRRCDEFVSRGFTEASRLRWRKVVSDALRIPEHTL